MADNGIPIHTVHTSYRCQSMIVASWSKLRVQSQSSLNIQNNLILGINMIYLQVYTIPIIYNENFAQTCACKYARQVVTDQINVDIRNDVVTRSRMQYKIPSYSCRDLCLCRGYCQFFWIVSKYSRDLDLAMHVFMGTIQSSTIEASCFSSSLEYFVHSRSC